MQKRGEKLIMALCVVALLVGTVRGTLAYFTDTDADTNTFTVGQVGLTLDEADVKTDGTYETTKDSRVTENTYHLLPGGEYIKDPTVHVSADSEKCWVFVKVVNEIAAIEDASNTVAKQMEDKGWTLVEGETGIYAYKQTVSAETDLVVFETFKISGDVDNDTLAAYEGKNINVTAYAVQAAGFDTALAAWQANEATFEN